MRSPRPDEPTDGLATVVVDERAGPAVVLRIHGELDSATVPGLRATVIEKLGATAQPVVVDVSGVAFLSSAGLRLFVDVHDRLAADGRALRLVTGGVRAVVRPLEVTGLDRRLRLYPDLPSALAD